MLTLLRLGTEWELVPRGAHREFDPRAEYEMREGDRVIATLARGVARAGASEWTFKREMYTFAIASASGQQIASGSLMKNWSLDFADGARFTASPQDFWMRTYQWSDGPIEIMTATLIPDPVPRGTILVPRGTESKHTIVLALFSWFMLLTDEWFRRQPE